MATRRLVVLAMTHMRSGNCTAGLLCGENDPQRGEWVRPVRPYGTLLLGDMTEPQGTVARVGDLVDLNLLRYRPVPPHTEDWEADFIRSRVKIQGRLEGDSWAHYLAAHAEPGPDAVLDRHERSLALFKPRSITAHFFLNRDVQTYEARLEFAFGDRIYATGASHPGFPVTDLAWRARGRTWCERMLPPGQQHLRLDHAQVAGELGCTDLYLSVGLTRQFGGQLWPILIGVYPLPESPVTIDYANP